LTVLTACPRRPTGEFANAHIGKRAAASCVTGCRPRPSSIDPEPLQRLAAQLGAALE